MFIQSAMSLIQQADSEAYCLLDTKPQAEIIATQDYLEAMGLIESRMFEDVTTMLGRIGKPH